VKLCKLCSSELLKRELPLEAFELMMPLNIVTAAEGEELEDDDEDPDTVKEPVDDELPYVASYEAVKRSVSWFNLAGFCRSDRLKRLERVFAWTSMFSAENDVGRPKIVSTTSSKFLSARMP